jgi:hypothetical protein
MAAKHIDGGTSDEVVFGDERDISGAHTLVRDAAVQRVFRRRLGCDCNLQLEVEVEGKANDVEAGANVGRRARDSDLGRHGEDEEVGSADATTVGCAAQKKS